MHIRQLLNERFKVLCFGHISKKKSFRRKTILFVYFNLISNDCRPFKVMVVPPFFPQLNRLFNIKGLIFFSVMNDSRICDFIKECVKTAFIIPITFSLITNLKIKTWIKLAVILCKPLIHNYLRIIEVIIMA